MTFIFRNRTIFWDISKWNRGKKSETKEVAFNGDWFFFFWGGAGGWEYVSGKVCLLNKHGVSPWVIPPTTQAVLVRWILWALVWPFLLSLTHGFHRLNWCLFGLDFMGPNWTKVISCFSWAISMVCGLEFAGRWSFVGLGDLFWICWWSEKR